MRDSDGRLLGAVTTLEDVTSLQATDRFKTQFIAVASRRLRDPLLQLRRGLYALGHGFAGELSPLQSDLVSAAARTRKSSTTSWPTSSKSPKSTPASASSSWNTSCRSRSLREAEDRFADQAAEKRIRIEIQAFADLSFVQRRSPRRPLHPRQPALQCHSLTPRRTAKSCSPPKR